MMKYGKLENAGKGVANHWRIKIMELLDKHPEITLIDISERLKMNFKTASVHVKRLVLSGLVEKWYQGNSQSHKLSEAGKDFLAFLRKLESLYL
ncbi:hypothetical protein COV42_02110 [Candidatus Campbellbacteria bacterium CG11_big_fil_rev_8_21_14_0_20_44_21]|uniref:HTH arsR-type domain-containing protein n=1 Tax=Candidatus Campbellbacteria bacterium CG22_combo_CG10-13_8_21_14_all_43_18 TaxID=1974530 RepID=A0A2H0DY28_9BACT|nr:MAG: hypothetical protein COW82_01725 [Candidatus Campbellbacteria bacterium CG22_combo_CG10-13_8_21_14_all_43_18]PIR24220.1 MAG: hypothetical protein COV42_02110 [Candidatus Campbellbacteria bacterium CG11_big_fil_rev_8_21_14_0_20_44_21]